MRRDPTMPPEPMRSTLPNTGQPRIPHSEYHCNWRRRSSERVDLGLRDLLPGALLSPRQAIFALHSFAFYFSRFFQVAFLYSLYIFSSRLLTYPLSSSSELGYRFVSYPQTTGPSGPLLCDRNVWSSTTTRLCAVVAFRYIVFPCSLFVGHYH